MCVVRECDVIILLHFAPYGYLYILFCACTYIMRSAGILIRVFIPVFFSSYIWQLSWLL